MLAERSGVRVHVTGQLPEAALASLQTGFAAPPPPASTPASAAVAPQRDHEVVASVPGFAPVSRGPAAPVPMAPPEEPSGKTMTSQAVRQLRQQPRTVVFTLDNGQDVAVSEFGLLGRNPSAEAGDPYAQLVAVPDGTRTVSKTHLAFAALPGRSG